MFFQVDENGYLAAFIVGNELDSSHESIFPHAPPCCRTSFHLLLTFQRYSPSQYAATMFCLPLTH